MSLNKFTYFIMHLLGELFHIKGAGGDVRTKVIYGAKESQCHFC